GARGARVQSIVRQRGARVGRDALARSPRDGAEYALWDRAPRTKGDLHAGPVFRRAGGAPVWKAGCGEYRAARARLAGRQARHVGRAIGADRRQSGTGGLAGGGGAGRLVRGGGGGGPGGAAVWWSRPPTTPLHLYTLSRSH